MSRAIGIDIGTTTLCGCVLDGGSGKLLEVASVPNRGAMPARFPGEDCQDPQIVLGDAQALCQRLVKACGAPAALGITGQMHGIVYVDARGMACSPLYTWKDGRGNCRTESGEGEGYVQRLSRLTGYPLATGYGAVTHYYNTINNLVPENAASFCTISDALALRIGRISKPKLHPSNAASLGLFDLKRRAFDATAIRMAGMDPSLFPEVLASDEPIGDGLDGVTILPPLGDNQAAFMGSVREADSALLINMGTGGQISCRAPGFMRASAGELRPYAGGDYLWVASALCGGRAYALLEQFFRQVARGAGAPEKPLYEWMNALAGQAFDLAEPLRIRTAFDGTRDNPAQRGAIEGLGVDNFTPAHFVAGVLQGVVDEISDAYGKVEQMLGRQATSLVVSGNGLRKNPAWRAMFEKRFGMPALIPAHREEAAYGAALYALVGAGEFNSIEDTQHMIKYTAI